MQGQYLQYSDAAPSCEVTIVDDAGKPKLGVTHATVGLTLQYRRPGAAAVSITLVAQTPTGAWAAGGFCHLAGEVYRLDLPTAATAASPARVTVLASAAPADTNVLPCTIALGVDNYSVAGATDATVASAVQTQLSDEFAAIPAAVATQVQSQLNDDFAAITPPSVSAIATGVALEIAPDFALIPTAAEIASAVGAPTLGQIATIIPTPPSAATIALAVDGQLTDNFAGVAPVSAAAIAAETLTQLATAPGATAREAIADSFLGRAIAGGSNIGRIVRDVFRAARNRVTRNVGTGILTVMQEDDTTPAWTATTTTDDTALPIVSVDPT